MIINYSIDIDIIQSNGNQNIYSWNGLPNQIDNEINRIQLELQKYKNHNIEFNIGIKFEKQCNIEFSGSLKGLIDNCHTLNISCYEI
jgi:hypothetical protein